MTRHTIIGEMSPEQKLSDQAIAQQLFDTKHEYFEFIHEKALSFTQRRIDDQRSTDAVLIEDYKLLQFLKEVEKGVHERSESADFLPDDAPIQKELAQLIAEVSEEELALEQRIQETAHSLIPNLSTILGEQLACHLLALAGSVEKLARMPASTIQVLGAEKALFRFLEGKGTAPKHGAIFQHPQVKSVQKSDRGQMARVVANKTSLAARIDAYGGEFQGYDLLHNVQQRYDELKRGGST